MKSNGLFRKFGFILVGSLISLSTTAQDSTDVAENEAEKPVIEADAGRGREYFEGSRGFLNGGPACITCHNVTNDELYPGGLLGKDLTTVYDRMGQTLVLWLDMPDNGAMTTSYQGHKLEENERIDLTAFFKHANEVKDTQTADSGQMMMLLGGFGGLAVILILISLIYMKRKRHMVKKDIFARQNSAWDAKH
ncbi:MAG: hypothetical protein QNK23_16035 [Crocinitomicaceae bacterium]|nr:hypothetical protein [Crocinitomicaceae bacterium]